MAESSWERHQASANMCLAQIDTVTHTLNHLVDEVITLKDQTLYSAIGESANEFAIAAKLNLMRLMEDARGAGMAAIEFAENVTNYKGSF